MKYLNTYSLHSLILENVQKAKSILKSLNIGLDDKSYLEIRNILKGHEGYLGWFVDLFYNKKYKISDLVELYDFIKMNSSYTSRLEKNITEYDNIEKLQDDIESLKMDSSLRRIYNEFPVKQKSFIDIKKDKEVLTQLSSRKDYKSFFRKVSSFHNRKTLLDNLTIFLKTDPTANLEKVMALAKKNGSEISYFNYENNILIVRVFSVNELNSIAGDCSWCIKNAGTFQSYVNDKSKQYVIFLFDRTDANSRIGVTMDYTRPNFFSTAHSKNDSFVHYDVLSKLLSEYEFDVRNIGFKLEELNINRTPVKDLMEVFRLSKEEIVNIKNVFSAKDINKFTKEEIEKWNLLEKSSINFNLLEKYSFEEIVSRKLMYRIETFFISDIVVFYGIIGIKFINYLKENEDILNNLSNEDLQFYKKMTKPKDMYNLKVKDDTDRHSRGYDYFKTLFRFIWFSKDIKKMAKDKGDYEHIIDSLDSVYLSNIRFLVEELGIPIDDLMPIVIKANHEVSEYYEKVIEYCKLESIDSKKLREDYLECILDSNIKEHNLKDYKKLFSESQYDEIDLEYKNQIFIKELSSFRLYNDKCSTSESKEFYKKFNKYIQTIDKIKGTWNAEELFVFLLIIYLRIGKLKELRVNFRFYSYNGQKAIQIIDEVISDTYFTNGGMKEKLTDKQKEELYRWLVSNDLTDLNLSRYSLGDEKTHEVHEGDPRNFYQRSIYLMDDESLEEYMDYASKVKYNVRKDRGYSMTGEVPRPGDSKMYATIRPVEVYPILKMLESKTKENKISKAEYISFVERILSWNLLIPEISWMLDRLENSDVRIILINKLIEKKASPKKIQSYKYPKAKDRYW